MGRKPEEIIRRGERLRRDDAGLFVNLADSEKHFFIGSDLDRATQFAKSVVRPGQPVYVCKIVRVVTGRIETDVEEAANA